ncbi:MAG: hypothetical protein ACETVX_02770 [bacterium]
MKLIYAWVAILVIVIAGVGLFIFQMYTMPNKSTKSELPKMRSNLAQKYVNKAEVLSDSALIMAEQLKAKQGSLTPDQERKINQLLDRAKRLKENAARLNEKKLSETEGQDILRACTSIYGEASGICNQLRTEVGK